MTGEQIIFLLVAGLTLVFALRVVTTGNLVHAANADQLHKPEEQRKPIGRITGIAVVVLVAVSAVYHTLIWRN